MGNKKVNRDLALKILDVVGAVKDALDDLLETMFIIYQPKDFYWSSVSDSGSFKVIAMNVDSYQWEYARLNDPDVWIDSGRPGNNTDTLQILASSTVRQNKYRCRLTDADGNIIYTNEVQLIQII